MNSLTPQRQESEADDYSLRLLKRGISPAGLATSFETGEPGSGRQSSMFDDRGVRRAQHALRWKNRSGRDQMKSERWCRMAA